MVKIPKKYVYPNFFVRGVKNGSCTVTHKTVVFVFVSFLMGAVIDFWINNKGLHQ